MVLEGNPGRPLLSSDGRAGPRLHEEGRGWGSQAVFAHLREPLETGCMRRSQHSKITMIHFDIGCRHVENSLKLHKSCKRI